MSKNVVVISTSVRKNSNSDVLADEFIKGAKSAGHRVEKITLDDKTIHFCKGCMVCQNRRTGQCILQDDGNAMIDRMVKADVITFATPIYFYEMSGQMKVLLDRTNPLFPVDYMFRDIYLITTAAEIERVAMEGAVNGLKGWIECFAKAQLQGVIYGTGVDDLGSIWQHSEHLNNAYRMGKGV